MLIKIDVDSETVGKIDQLITRKRYSDLYQFIKLAISNQLEEELSGTSDNFRTVSLTEQLHGAVEESLKEVEALVGPHWRKAVQGMKLERSEVKPTKPLEPLIWSFYNRFFPVKIVIYQLAKVLVKENKNWIELNDIQTSAFQLAEKISSQLRDYEIKNKISRNEKLSTGLPISESELKGLKGAKKRKKEAKLLASKIRFMEQFVGRYSAKHRNFSGACFELGLMSVKPLGDTCFVSLTESGRRFAVMLNPILDQDTQKKTFSDEEVKFIIKEIYPQFELEKRIVSRVIDELKNRQLTSNDIDAIFKNDKTEYYGSMDIPPVDRELLTDETITTQRVATMGRLSELGIVNWAIDSKGKSLYSLNPQRVQLVL